MEKIKAMVNVSMLDNATQNYIAEEFGLSDASSYIVAYTEDNKLFLYKGEIRITDPLGGDSDRIKVCEESAKMINEIFNSLRKEKKENETNVGGIG